MQIRGPRKPRNFYEKMPEGIEDVQLQANSNVGTYIWTPLVSLTCYDCPNPIASPTTTTDYIVTTTTEFGCKKTDTLVVSANKCNETNILVTTQKTNRLRRIANLNFKIN